MTDTVLFQMWEPVRSDLIKKHKFYFEQARSRLLTQFDDIEAEADAFAEKWLSDTNVYFDPDRHDPADIYEQAHEEAIEFYLLLSDMRDATRLAVLTGVFHAWEKQLRKWLTDEIRHWHRGDGLRTRIWKAKFDEVVELFENLGWDIKQESFYTDLDLCRLVVNVYKHGEGTAFDRLKAEFPEIFTLLWRADTDDEEDIRFIDFEQLEISEDHLDEFSNAIVEFWQTVPDEISTAQNLSVPDWFQRVYDRDIQQSSNQGAY